MAFSNPITGAQGALIRPAIKSPDYAPGSLGWSINRDGSAEFNNLTVRGVFAGTDFVINNAGEFFYSGTPAAGNLVASIAPVAGTDAFGNHYLQGFTSYSATAFAQMNSGILDIGTVTGGVPDQADAAKISASATDAAFISVSTVADPSPAVMTLLPGAATAVPNGTEPSMLLRGGNFPTAASLLVAGATVKADNSGVAYPWQVPGVAGATAFNANWSGSTTFNGTANWGSFQFRLTAEDEVWVLGGFKAAAGAGAAIIKLVAPYVPAGQWPVWVQRNNAGVLSGFFAEIGPSGNFNILAGSGGGVAAGNEYLVNAKIPLGNLP